MKLFQEIAANANSLSAIYGMNVRNKPHLKRKRKKNSSGLNQQF